MAVATLGSQLRVFLCHATEDKPMIRQLYDDLSGADIEPWLDEKCLKPGQDWNLEIQAAVRSVDVVIVGSVAKFVSGLCAFGFLELSDQAASTAFQSSGIVAERPPNLPVLN